MKTLGQGQGFKYKPLDRRTFLAHCWLSSLINLRLCGRGQQTPRLPQLAACKTRSAAFEPNQVCRTLCTAPCGSRAPLLLSDTCWTSPSGRAWRAVRPPPTSSRFGAARVACPCNDGRPHPPLLLCPGPPLPFWLNGKSCILRCFSTRCRIRLHNVYTGVTATAGAEAGLSSNGASSSAGATPGIAACPRRSILTGPCRSPTACRPKPARSSPPAGLGWPCHRSRRTDSPRRSNPWVGWRHPKKSPQPGSFRQNCTKRSLAQPRCSFEGGAVQEGVFVPRWPPHCSLRGILEADV